MTGRTARADHRGESKAPATGTRAPVIVELACSEQACAFNAPDSCDRGGCLFEQAKDRLVAAKARRVTDAGIGSRRK